MTNEQNKNQEEKVLVRILSKDIKGNLGLYPGLTKVKGISWALSNAICIELKLDKRKKISQLTKEEIRKIEEFMENPSINKFLMNRRRDPETGDNKHLLGVKLDLRKEFDIKRLKKIKSYKGSRHSQNLPVRGQRTKNHFRTNRKKGMGIKKKKVS